MSEAWDAKAKELGIELKPDFPFYCLTEPDDSMTLYWDPNHPITSVFNTWSEEDFTECIVTAAKEVLERHKKPCVAS
jgi:hypothetical protein